MSGYCSAQPRRAGRERQLDGRGHGRRQAESRREHQRRFPIAKRRPNPRRAIEPFIDRKVDLERGLEIREQITRGRRVQRIGPLGALRRGDRELRDDLEVVAQERLGGGGERGHLVRCRRSGRPPSASCAFTAAMRVCATDNWLVRAREMSCAIVIARSPNGETSNGCESNSAVESAVIEDEQGGKGLPGAVLNRLELRQASLQGGSLWRAGLRAAARELRGEDRAVDADDQLGGLQRGETIGIAGAGGKQVVGVQGVGEVGELLRPARDEIRRLREKVRERRHAARHRRSPNPRKAAPSAPPAPAGSRRRARNASTCAMICARFAVVSASSGASVVLTKRVDVAG